MMIMINNDWSVQKRNQDSQPPRRHPPQASRPCEEREEYPEGAPQIHISQYIHIIPDNCRRRGRRRQCKFFWPV